MFTPNTIIRHNYLKKVDFLFLTQTAMVEVHNFEGQKSAHYSRVHFCFISESYTGLLFFRWTGTLVDVNFAPTNLIFQIFKCEWIQFYKAIKFIYFKVVDHTSKFRI